MRYLSFVLILAICGCSGKSSTSKASVLTSVSGMVFAGSPFSSGTVSIYGYMAGEKGTLLVSGRVDDTGAYRVSVPDIPEAIFVEVSGGCYTETATPWVAVENGNSGIRFYNDKPYAAENVKVPNVCPSEKLLTAITVSTGTPSLVVGVTPYTHAAVGLAEYLHRTGETVSAAINDANTKLSQLAGVDIVKTLPAESTRNSMPSDSSIYGALLAGIPSYIYNLPANRSSSFGTGTLTTLHFADSMKMDLEQDGVLNGIGRDGSGSTVSVSVGGIPLTTDIYRHQVALYSVFRFRAETEGASRPFATASEVARIIDFLPALNKYNNSSSNLFDSSPVVRLDIQGPKIALDGPLDGAVMSNSTSTMSGLIHSNVGVNGNFVGGYIFSDGRYITDGRDSNVVILVDGKYHTAIEYYKDVYRFSGSITTSMFSNGPHVVTLNVTNNLGQTSSVSVNVTFAN